MALLRHRLASSLVLAVPLLACGCDRISRSWQTRDDAKYELRQDAQGNIIRLNKVTGEVTVVSHAKAIPSRAPERRSSPPPNPVPSPQPPPPPGKPEQVSSPARAPEVVPSVAAKLPVGSRITITNPSPVFLLPDGNRTPLTVLAAGSVAKVLGTEGEWYHIEFDDPRWGKRVAYVATKGAGGDVGGQPVNVSVNAPKQAAVGPTDPHHPADLSVRKAKTNEMKPVDVSIPKRK